MRSQETTSSWWLGIEGGGTKTTAIAESDLPGKRVERRLGPGNLRLLSDVQLRRLFRQIARATPHPVAIGIGLAGARTARDRGRVQAAAATVWPGVPCRATHDLETALRADARVAAGTAPPEGWTRVLILCGTGSCCYGQSPDGQTAKIGGWGHLLGDKGSGYDIGLRALKAVVYYLDRDGTWSRLGRSLLGFLQLNEPEAFIDWMARATKSEVAALAALVFDAARARDPIALDILEGAANSLAKDASAVAKRLAPREAPVRFVLAGGVFEHRPEFVRRLKGLLLKHRPGAAVHHLKNGTAIGAVALAREPPTDTPKAPSRSNTATRPSQPEGFVPDLAALGHSPTEQRHPRSTHLDKLTVEEAVTLFLEEDRRVTRGLLAERPALVRGIDLIVRGLRKGGRLFYVGAGTSGRLGVLDASECPPTFHTSPDMVQGIMAGGASALHRSVEGAEDDPGAGAQALQGRGAGPRDTVVGIAASGRTPFVWGALREARRVGAGTILVTFNPDLTIPRKERPNVVIAPRIGPELLTGSTRLKAGTATKLILNLFTTLAMVRLGKVMGNLMIDVHPSNDKLRQRAQRMVQTLTGASPALSEAALRAQGWDIRKAVAYLKAKSTPQRRP